jgi:hypothetical protein
MMTALVLARIVVAVLLIVAVAVAVWVTIEPVDLR